MRTSRYLFSERFSPWMRGIAEQHRSPLPADNALLVRERSVSGQVFNAIENLRKGRDATEEQIFTLAYGAALGAAAAGAAGRPRRRDPSKS